MLNLKNFSSVSIPEKRETPFEACDEYYYKIRDAWFQSLRKGKHPLKMYFLKDYLDIYQVSIPEKRETPFEATTIFQILPLLLSFNPWEKGNTLWRLEMLPEKQLAPHVSIPEKRETPFEDNCPTYVANHFVVSIPEKRETPFEEPLFFQKHVTGGSFNPWEKGNTLWRHPVRSIEYMFDLVFQSLRKGKHPLKMYFLKDYLDIYQVSIPEKRETPFEATTIFQILPLLLSFNPWEKGNTLWRLEMLPEKQLAPHVSIPEKRETPFEDNCPTYVANHFVVSIPEKRETPFEEPLFFQKHVTGGSFNPWEKGNTLWSFTIR